MSHAADIPIADPGTLIEIHRHDLAGVGQQDLVPAIQIEVGRQGVAQVTGRSIGQRLCLDQLTERREPQVSQVDAAEHAVPVDVVRLAAQEVVVGLVAERPRRQPVDLGRHPKHAFVDVVDLAVLDLEIPPRGSAHPARLGSALGAIALEGLHE